MNLLGLRNFLKQQTLIPYSDEVVDSYLNQAYLDLATRHDWSWLEVTHTFELEPEVAEYPLPEDFNTLRAVIYTARGAEAQPKRTTRDSVLGRFGSVVNDSDLPAEYFQQGSNLIFTPTPSALQEVVLLYYQRPTALVDEEEAPLFDPAFHIYLPQAASALYFESEESYEYAGFYHAKAADTFARMARFYDLQLPPEQPLIIGGGHRRFREIRPFDNWTG